MDNEDFKLTETGINPVNTAGNSSDLYFTNVNAEEKSTSEPDKNIRPAVRRSASRETAGRASSHRVTSGSAQGKKRRPVKRKSGVAGTYVFFAVVIVLSMLISVYAILCMNDVLAITKTTSTVTVSVESQIKDIDGAVDLLADNGLIKCKNFCKLFAKYREAQVGAPYEAGIYYLNGKMGLEGMLQTLQGDSTTAETVTITFPEGYTVPEIIEKLDENEVCTKEALLSVIQTVDFSYSLVTDLTAKEEVPYRLEGYLFPDTYEFYIGENATSVVRKFLKNGDEKIKEKYRKRAEKLGYSMDDIIKIASIIQCEAGSEDQMKTISAVIHNRLSDTANFPLLGVDSTADYITNKVAPALTSTSSHTSDYYMEYYSTTGSSTVVGLPPSPICNPGIAAIEAALYPDDVDYYYFFHDTDGNMYTAKTYSEFKQKAATYAPYLNIS